MPYFSETSVRKLDTCHHDLIRLMNEVIKNLDITIVDGYRDKDIQNYYYSIKRSKVRYPDSKHNNYPSLAVDVAPFNPKVPGGIDWKDTASFYYMAGYIKGAAQLLGIEIRWGGDWDRDNDLHDQKFNDLPHFELYGDRQT